MVGFVVRIGGAEYGELGTGAGGVQGGGTKVVPSGDSDSTITFEVFIKSIMQAPVVEQQVFSPEEKEADAKRKRNQLKQVAFALLAIVLFLGSGAVFYPLVEGWTVLDSFYFGMVTITTVGYGDMGPVTQAGRIFTSFFVLGGVGIIGEQLVS